MSTDNQFAERPTTGHRVNAPIDAFWDEERGPIKGKLLECRVMKGDYGPSVLFVFEAAHKVPIVDPEDKNAVADKGAVIGVWGSAGMRALKGMANCIVWMQCLGKAQVKDGKRSVWRYDIVQESGEGGPLRVLDQRPSETDGKPKEVPTGKELTIDDLPF